MAVGPICASYKPPPPRWGYLMVIERRSVPVRTLGPGLPVAFMRACRWIICAPSRTVLRQARLARASIDSSAAVNSPTPSRSNSRVAMSRLPLGLGALLPLRQALLDLLVDRQQPVAQRRRRGLRLGYGPAEGAAELVGAEVGGEAAGGDEGGVTSGADLLQHLAVLAGQRPRRTGSIRQRPAGDQPLEELVVRLDRPWPSLRLVGVLVDGHDRPAVPVADLLHVVAEGGPLVVFEFDAHPRSSGGSRAGRGGWRPTETRSLPTVGRQRVDRGSTLGVSAHTHRKEGP